MDIAAGKSPGKRPAILLLERDPAVRRPLQLLLEAKGFDVRAHSSEDALLADTNAALANCLLVCEAEMRDENCELLRRLRDREWYGPAFLAARRFDESSRNRAKEAGFVALFDQANKQGDLVRKVVDWANGSTVAG